MQSDELDDLFRQELGGHASQPGADLWARLQARSAAAAPGPGADPLDAQFRAGLAGHATPPRRELWERLEDEHLRPRQRRRPVVAWGRLAVAASLLLLVLAGGAGLWLRSNRPARGPVAATTPSQPAGQPSTTPGALATAARPAPPSPAATAGTAARRPGGAAQVAAKSSREKLALAAAASLYEKRAKNLPPQATASLALSSSSSVARTIRPRRPAPAPQLVPQLPVTRPDAAGNQLASRGGQPSPGNQSAPAPATLAATELQVIEVDVRRGGVAARPAASAVAAVPAPAEEVTAAPGRPHLRLRGLLRQAGHALQGESVSLAEATGLPESMTFQARLGGRIVSKTIQL